MWVKNATPMLAAELACTGEWIDVTMPESLDGMARAGIWADVCCVRGETGVAIKRTRGEAR